jgi:membrane protein implicated in regulation of membrane protease activity
VVPRRGPGSVAAQVGRAVLVEQPGEDGVGRAKVGDRGGRAQGWPSTAPGTPVFVEYFGWIFISGRIRCTAWATAIAASA